MAPITGDSDKGAAYAPLVMYVFNVRVCSVIASGFVALRFFSVAACYEAHLPSVTVRDENAGRPNVLQARLQLSHSSQTNGVAGVG
jgi:hypothetical protein